MEQSLLDLIVPSRTGVPALAVTADVPADADALAVFVTTDADVPAELGVDRAALERAGFTARPGTALALPAGAGPVQVAVGIGARGEWGIAGVRDAAAAFARAVPRDGSLAVEVKDLGDLPPRDVARALVEGVLLTRHRWERRTSTPAEAPVTTLTLVADPALSDDVNEGVRLGLVGARVGLLARDLATCPAQWLTAEAIAEVAQVVGGETGLDVEVHDRASLEELGCGGLLGVNRGSAREPRMVVLRYRPTGEPTGRLALVGKGITFDSGGISLKPGDESHSQMKNDMTGAGDVLAAMSALRDLDCPAEVIGYMMCTDNMPSGSALQLGDIITMRGGTTVEVLNTDAEGRLVMADALALAVEEDVDAIIDIATLTGACLRALGVRLSGVMGSSPDLVAQVRAAGEVVDEPVWEFPLVEAYRAELDSDVADLRNIGGPNAGQITAGLFLRAFTGEIPWVHLDIAGTAQAPAEDRWVRRGPTGTGARLLAWTAASFTSPSN